MVRKENIVTVVATCWEVLVVVLVTSSAFSLAKFGISPLCLRDWLCWVALMMVARLPKPKTLILLNFSFDCILILQPEQHHWQWLRHRPGFLCCRPVFWVQRFACMADQPSCWLLFLLPLLHVSHYDVPQQGLLGELILIQQQIQRHEEEVRRAAAANNARPPPPEPAPSPPSNPSPPQQKRKVKVPTHLDPPYPTNAEKKHNICSRTV